MMDRQRAINKNQYAQTKTSLLPMMGRQRPVHKSRWADKDPIIIHDGQTKTKL